MNAPWKKAPAPMIHVFGAADFERIPQGHFLVQSGTGKVTLGHNGPMGLHWSVTRPAAMTHEEFEKLPLIRLRLLGLMQTAVAHLGEHVLLDSQRLDEFSGEFQWDEGF